MRTEEARDLFSEAFDGELDAERDAAFQAALAEDEDLSADYDDFVSTFQMIGSLDRNVQAPNLLPKIQDRLRRRSRGRYYRDRFSERAGQMSWMIMLLAIVTVLLVVGATIFAMQQNELDAPPPTGGAAAERVNPG